MTEKDKETTEISYGFIFIAVFVMFLVLWVIVTSVSQVTSSDAPMVSKQKQTSMKKKKLISWKKKSVPGNHQTRSLSRYYSRRAYHGAPPRIPHGTQEVNGKMDNCLACHRKGGYVPSMKKFTPVTPHPELTNCVQCHVPQKTKELFRSISWVSAKPPKLGYSKLPGGPPPIPHSLQMRKNCVSCHAGPAAVKAMKTPHPYRSNCVQCHVPKVTNKTFQSVFSGFMKEKKQ